MVFELFSRHRNERFSNNSNVRMVLRVKTKRTKRKRITNQEQTRTKRETMQAVVKKFNLVIAQGRRKLLILKLNKKRLTYVAVFGLLVSAKTKRFQTN